MPWYVFTEWASFETHFDGIISICYSSTYHTWVSLIIAHSRFSACWSKALLVILLLISIGGIRLLERQLLCCWGSSFVILETVFDLWIISWFIIINAELDVHHVLLMQGVYLCVCQVFVACRFSRFDWDVQRRSLSLQQDICVFQQDDLKWGFKRTEWSCVFINLKVDEVLHHFEKNINKSSNLRLTYHIGAYRQPGILAERDLIFSKSNFLIAPVIGYLSLYISPYQLDQLQLLFDFLLICQ